MATYTVLDVSKYNTVSNYNAAAASIHGVIIRTGYRGYGSSGTLVKDSLFETHYNGFLGKTKLGVYWFSQAITEAEAIAEANYVYNIIKGRNIDFPIYIDSEYSNNNHNGRADSLSKSDRTTITIAFCERMKELGYRVGVYASDSWFKNNLNTPQLQSKGYSIWVARYSTSKPVNVSNYDGWQFSSNNTVNGVVGRCDLSYFYNDIAGWTTIKPDINTYTLTVPNQIFDYTGKAIEPSFTLGNLTLNTDYICEYSNNINTGTATCKITGVNNYQGTRYFTYTINALSISKKQLILSGYGFTYTGSEIKPTATIEGLNSSDFDIKYIENINVGSAKAIATGKGNYKDSISATYTISRRTIDSYNISISSESYEYTGSPITPQVTILGLIEGTDFNVEYLNNIEIGTATINARGINNYSGIKTITFRIAKAAINITEYNVSMSYDTTIYNREAQLPDIIVGDLIQDKDYRIDVRDNINVGIATINIIGINDYTGTIIKTFTILKQSIDDYSLIIPQDFYYYTGKAIEPVTVINNLEVGIDYDVIYENNINVGTASIICIGKNNYEGSIFINFEIKSSIIKSKDIILDNYTYIYDSREKTPFVSINNLVNNIDYKVKYKNNINAGTASVIVIGIGNYSGEVSIPFTINRQLITNREVIIDQSEYYYNTKPICPIPYISDLIPDRDYKVEYYDNINVGIARLIISGINNYQGDITIKYKILEKDIQTCIAKYGKPSTKTIYRVEDGKGLRIFTDYTEKIELIADINYQINSHTKKEGEEFNIISYTVKGFGGFFGEANYIFRVVDVEPDIHIDYEDDGVYNFGNIDEQDMSAYGNYDFKELDDSLNIMSLSDEEVPDMVKDGEDYNFDAMSGMYLDTYDEDDGSNITPDGSDKKDPEEQKDDDDGVYNFGDIDLNDETAIGDYDFGDLDEGVDPDSVANGDYDFNNFAGDVQEWIAAGTEFVLNDTPMYTTYSSSTSFENKSGTYYIYNSKVVNDRIRMARTESAVDSPGRSCGWCKTQDLLNLEDFKVGDRVLVDGRIYMYANGTGGYVDAKGKAMYITEILDKAQYSHPYALSNSIKSSRIGFALEEILTKIEKF